MADDDNPGGYAPVEDDGPGYVPGALPIRLASASSPVFGPSSPHQLGRAGSNYSPRIRKKTIGTKLLLIYFYLCFAAMSRGHIARCNLLCFSWKSPSQYQTCVCYFDRLDGPRFGRVLLVAVATTQPVCHAGVPTRACVLANYLVRMRVYVEIQMRYSLVFPPPLGVQLLSFNSTNGPQWQNAAARNQWRTSFLFWSIPSCRCVFVVVLIFLIGLYFQKRSQTVACG